MSLFFRQTNIIWIFFCSTVSLLYQKTTLSERIRTMDKEILAIKIEPHRRYFYDELVAVGTHLVFGILLDEVKLKRLVRSLTPLVLATVAFGAFLALNGAIVLGDKDAHQATLNILQLFYFSLFSCFFFWPTLLFEVAPLFRFFRRYLVLYLAVTAVVLMLVKEHTIVHPYNLADNRHLVFYAWRLMSRFRFPLVPLYSASFFIMVYALPKSFFFQLSYWLCTFVVLVSQGLFEFRYFMIPFVLFALFSTLTTRWLALLNNVTISALVFYLFATKEITWPDEENVQRMFW